MTEITSFPHISCYKGMLESDHKLFFSNCMLLIFLLSVQLPKFFLHYLMSLVVFMQLGVLTSHKSARLVYRSEYLHCHSCCQLKCII